MHQSLLHWALKVSWTSHMQIWTRDGRFSILKLLHQSGVEEGQHIWMILLFGPSHYGSTPGRPACTYKQGIGLWRTMHWYCTEILIQFFNTSPNPTQWQSASTVGLRKGLVHFCLDQRLWLQYQNPETMLQMIKWKFVGRQIVPNDIKQGFAVFNFLEVIIVKEHQDGQIRICIAWCDVRQCPVRWNMTSNFLCNCQRTVNGQFKILSSRPGYVVLGHKLHTDAWIMWSSCFCVL